MSLHGLLRLHDADRLDSCFCMWDGDNEADSIYCCGWNEHRNLAVSLPPAEDDIFDWSFAIKDINKLASPPTCSKSEETEEERSFFMAAGGAHFLAILV